MIGRIRIRIQYSGVNYSNIRIFEYSLQPWYQTLQQWRGLNEWQLLVMDFCLDHLPRTYHVSRYARLMLRIMQCVCCLVMFCLAADLSSVLLVIYLDTSLKFTKRRRHRLHTQGVATASLSFILQITTSPTAIVTVIVLDHVLSYDTFTGLWFTEMSHCIVVLSRAFFVLTTCSTFQKSSIIYLVREDKLLLATKTFF